MITRSTPGRTGATRSRSGDREGALLAIAHTLNASLDLQEVLDEVLRVTCDALGAAGVSLFMPELDGEQSELRVSFLQAEGPVKTAVVSANLGISAEVLETGESIVVDDVRGAPRFEGKLDSAFGVRTRALMAVALRRGNRPIGLMEAIRETDEPFEEEDLDFFEAVASEVAVAVQNSTLLERLRRELREREILLDVSRQVGGVLDLDEVLDHILDALEEMLPFDAGGIFLVDEEKGSLRVFAQRGYEPDLEAILETEDGGGIVGSVVENRRGVIVHDVRSDPRYIEARPSTESEIAAPIVSGGDVLGVITLESDEEEIYTQRELHLFELVASQVSSAIVNARLHESRLRQTQVEHELGLAREIQVGLFPDDTLPRPGVEVDGVNVPSQTVGGDYYDFFAECDRHVALTIADVSGHGLHAALLMASMRAGVRLQTTHCPSLDQVAGDLNRLLAGCSLRNQFVAAVLSLLDAESGVLRYCNAGHQPPLRIGSRRTDRLEGGGFPLGMFEDAAYEVKELALEPGDLLVFFTDGLVEATDGDGEEFGTDRLVETVREVRDRPVGEVIGRVRQAVRAHRVPGGLADDVTLVVARWNPGSGGV